LVPFSGLKSKVFRHVAQRIGSRSPSDSVSACASKTLRAASFLRISCAQEGFRTALGFHVRAADDGDRRHRADVFGLRLDVSLVVEVRVLGET
jgi:hypothetical protein